MKKYYKKTNLLFIKPALTLMLSNTFRSFTLLAIIALIGFGCKKNSTAIDRDYGYAKLTIACQNKCQVSYGSADSLTLNNNIEVDKSMAVYYIRYKANYNLNINVTPIDVDQNVEVYAYSRQGKEIFKSVKIQKVGELMSANVIIP